MSIDTDNSNVDGGDFKVPPFFKEIPTFAEIAALGSDFNGAYEALRRKYARLQNYVDGGLPQVQKIIDESLLTFADHVAATEKYDSEWFEATYFSASAKSDLAKWLIDKVSPYTGLEGIPNLWKEMAGFSTSFDVDR